MSNTTTAEIQNFQGKYPKQLWYLFFSEMWERFSFYGMRGMLTYFMVNQLMMNERDANLQYGATQAFVYAFTFIGGLFADKILGFRKSLFWGGILMIIGSVILAMNPQEFFFMGIAFNIIGTGFFKPNISTMVGRLYKDNDDRRDAGFSLFYSGINIGALLGGYACIALGKSYSWNVAFGLAAVVMTISLLTFIFTQKQMGDIGVSPLLADDAAVRKRKEWMVFIGGVSPLLADDAAVRKRKEWMVFIGSVLCIPLISIMVKQTEYTDYFMYAIGPITLLYFVIETLKLNNNEQKKMWAALIFILFSILFWAFFEQSGGSLSIFAANHLSTELLGSITLDPNGVNNAANSLFVILFAPILGIIWIALSRKKIEPNTTVKFGLGFIFLGFAFLIFYATIFMADANGITSLDVFTMAYFIITLGELCLSPIGLSIMTKLAPTHLQGMMMGMWFLASAYGQYVAGILGAGMSTPEENASGLEKLTTYTNGYQQLAWIAFIAGIVLFLLSPIVKKLMQDVK
jgi:proton-dependent oligopeptide transporter, POT family